MSYKTFDSPDGTKWEVWLVQPTSAERRRSQRRVFANSSTSAYSGPERRFSPDRRRVDGEGRKFVSPEFENGWLCFESEAGDKRRLAPVPDSWENASTEKLWMWCRAATQVVKCGPKEEATDD